MTGLRIHARLLAALPALVACQKMGMMGMGMAKQAEEAAQAEEGAEEWPESLDKNVDQYMANCTWWLERKPYVRFWHERTEYQTAHRRLHEEHDLHCTPKPHDGLEPRGMLDCGIADSSEALAELAAYDEEVWNEEAYRQKKFTVHSQTQSILLRWKADFFDDVLELPRWPRWSAILKPVVQKFCEAQGYDYDEVEIWKAMLARLPAGAHITKHVDLQQSLAFAHRVHWVVTPEADTVTHIGNETFTSKELVPGLVFEFNNVLMHEVINDGDTARIHAILDIVPKKMHEQEVRRVTEIGKKV